MNACLQWDGTLFSNGAFSSKQPITQYDLAYHNSIASQALSTIGIVDSKLQIFSGRNGSTSNPMKVVACPNEKLNFDNMKYSSITISGSIATWESAYKWEIGLCDNIPTSFDWDSVFTSVIAQKDTIADYNDSFSVTIPLSNISGEKYLCIRCSNTSGSRSITMSIEKMIFNG